MSENMKDLNLLIKFPTRSRPEKFFAVLDVYYSFLLSNNVRFLISCDYDDATMNNESVKSRLKTYPNLDVFFSHNTSKIQAVNADMTGMSFDILLLASDDMIPVKRGYDVYIKNIFKYTFDGDTDNVAWFNDGFQGQRLNTLSILGKKFYERFGYIYNPDYESLYCDAEFTCIIKQLNRYVYSDMVIIKHQQYSIINEKPDDLYIRNDRLERKDRETFLKRSAANFFL